MAVGYVENPEDIVKLGDVVHVRVADILDDGKIKFTMLTPEQEAEQAASRPQGGDRGDRSDRPSFRGGRGGDRRGGFRGGDRGRGGRGGRSY